MRKKIIAMIITGILAVSVTACQSDGEQSSSQSQNSGQTESSANVEIPEDANILVAYFTYGENAKLPDGVDASSSASIQAWDGDTTGNTGLAAHWISDAAGGDLFSIQTEEKYPGDYDDTVDQGQEEQSENARPKLSSHVDHMDQYDVVFLGYPNWWGDMPMAVYSFLDEYDLSGKTVIPFVTSGGSGFSDTVSAIKEEEPDADVQEGLELSDSETADSEDEVKSWVESLGVN
ncbi:flavodoxin [Anaerostipes butyraticus]|nr:flavodoxin [Anaerostipes butyraticus]